MEQPAESLKIVVHAGSEHMTADLALAAGEAWVESAASLRDTAGQTSLVAWIASRKHGERIWEIEWELSSAGCDPIDPDARATTVCIDHVGVMVPMPAQDDQDYLHLEHQNPRSHGWTLADQCVLPPRRLICGRMGLGPGTEEHALGELALGLPSIDSYTAGRFGPANWPLPIYDQKQQNEKWRGKFTALRACLSAGATFEGEDEEDGIHQDALKCGWSTPYYSVDGSVHSGVDQFLSGWEGLWHGRYALLSHMLVAQRMQVAYNVSAGFQPLSVDHYPVESPLYSEDEELPEFRNMRVIGTVQEPIYTTTFSFGDVPLDRDIDAQRKAIEGYEYFKSPLCRRHLLARAEDRRLMFSEKGPKRRDGWTPLNLRNMLALASQRPHEGSLIEAGFGWALHAAAMLFKIKEHDAGREWRQWARKVQSFLTTCAKPGGETGRYLADSDHAVIAWGAYALEIQSRATIGEWAAEGFKSIYRATAPPSKTNREVACALASRLTKDPKWLDIAACTHDAYNYAPSYVRDSITMLEDAGDDPACHARAVVVAEYQRTLREGRL